MGSTVYDFSGHPDARGSLYGKDAFSVPKYWTPQSIRDEENRDKEFDLSTYPPSGKGKEKETTPDPDSRSAKRRKIVHDFEFLDTSLPHAVQAAPTSPSAFAVPSSDLLKCIHHFACNYYSDRGQLFSASRTYRKTKKQRHLAKLAAKRNPPPDDGNSGEEEPAPDPDTDPPKTQKERRRDMYKTMDGSALLAIGMLLQEHIARMLAPRIPDGWEQGALNESEEDDEEDEEDEEKEEQESNGEVEDAENDGDEDSSDDDENSNGGEHWENHEHDREDDGEDDAEDDGNREKPQSRHPPLDGGSESDPDWDEEEE